MSGFSFSDLQKVAKEAGYDLVPDGEYESVVKAGVKCVKTQGGKDMFKMTFAVNDGPIKGSVFNNMVISPESAPALAIFFRQMAALGLGDDFFATNPSMDQVCSALVGRRARIVVGKREWQGQERNEVQAIKSSKIAAGEVVSPTATNGSKSAGVPTVKAAPAGVPANLPKAGAAKKPAATPTPAPAPAEEVADEAQTTQPAPAEDVEFEDAPF